jgi:hypothetical protein
MARPPQEAIETFISITSADEAAAVRALEVTTPPRPPSAPLTSPPIGALDLCAWGFVASG